MLQQHGQVDTNTILMVKAINIFTVQNLLLSLCYALEKDTLLLSLALIHYLQSLVDYLLNFKKSSKLARLVTTTQ